MNVLVVAAHPDDEVLGCAGTIARHASEGDVVDVLIVAEGAASRDPTRETKASELKALQEAAAAASRVLGARPPLFGGLPDNRLDSVDLLDVVKLVEQQVAAVSPAVVYTHHGGDLNIDHRIVHSAVLTAARPIPGASIRAVYAFEIPSSTNWASASLGAPFMPTRLVDISPHLGAKSAALECYATEMRPFPHERSVEGVLALATWRGAAVGVNAAEAFEVVRELVP
jgi:N-acetylglucosamine malate deacetylase 1